MDDEVSLHLFWNGHLNERLKFKMQLSMLINKTKMCSITHVRLRTISPPVIIIGMHRSGTSMLTRLLCALGFYMGKHLSVNAESFFFHNLNESILAAAGSQWFNIRSAIEMMDSPDFLNQQVANLEERLLRRCEIYNFFRMKQLLMLWLGLDPGPWGWKNPRNSVTLPIWLKIFPRAKVIHVIRNGIDVAISLHRRETGRSPSDPDYSRECQDFSYCFRLWEEYVKVGRKHDERVLPGHYLEIRYEDILLEPDKELRNVLAFLGRKKTRVEKLDKAISMVDRNISKRSHLRDRYQKEISALPVSPLMVELGYA